MSWSREASLKRGTAHKELKLCRSEPHKYLGKESSKQKEKWVQRPWGRNLPCSFSIRTSSLQLSQTSHSSSCLLSSGDIEGEGPLHSGTLTHTAALPCSLSPTGPHCDLVSGPIRGSGQIHASFSLWSPTVWSPQVITVHITLGAILCLHHNHILGCWAESL